MLPFGTVYLIDPDIPPEKQRRDLENIKKLDFNTVILWPPVSRWEGKPYGATVFDSVDRIMNSCNELGLKVILELMGQAIDGEAVPQFLCGTDGVPPLNHPERRRLMSEYIREVVTHFRGHPALLGYILFNEVHHTTKDEWTLKAFVEFLRKQYDNNIIKLNKAWRTYYGNFENIAEIPPGSWVPDVYNYWKSIMNKRDWFRFQPANFADLLNEWYDTVRKYDPEIPIQTDIVSCDTLTNRIQYGTNDRATAETVDVFGISCYPPIDFNPDWWRKESYGWAQWLRTSYSAANDRQLVISEMMTQRRTMFPPDDSSMTDQTKLWGYQALFNGVTGIIYWKYRPFRTGFQVGGRGLTNSAGEPNIHAAQAKEIAEFAARHSNDLLSATPDSAGCAILHDQNTQHIYECIFPEKGNFYVNAIKGIFRGFWSKGISPAFITPEDIINGVQEKFKVIAVPVNAAVSQSTAHALVEFVKRGGVLLTESRFGLVDENATLWNHAPGGNMHTEFGIEEIEFTTRMNNSLQIYDSKKNLFLKNDYFQFFRTEKNVEAIIKIKSGEPALLKTKIGKGLYLHVPFLLGHKIYEEIDGAHDFFSLIYNLLNSKLKPSVSVIEKPELVDVSILKNKNGKPFMVGITNYEHKNAKIKLNWKCLPKNIECNSETTAELEGEILIVEVPAREAAAIFL